MTTIAHSDQSGHAVTPEPHPQAEEAISRLWSLKKCYDELASGKPPLNFHRLIRDPDFRDEVLRRLSRVKSSRLRAQAEELIAMNLQGSLHVDDQPLSREPSRLAGQNPDIAATREFQDRVLRQKRRWQWLSGVLATGLLVSLLVHAFPLWQQWQSGEIQVSGSITQDTHWSARNTYQLSGLVYVESNAVLTIEAGTIIKGSEGAALVVTRDARLVARGTPDAPIIFTSAREAGERDRGDWGGLVLLGNAPVNTDKAQIEGVPESDARGYFGGHDPASNCGILEYVRIEFSGYEVYPDNELNGLTLGGCGSQTIVRNVQVHKSLDDGIEIFGGNVNLKQVLVTVAGDDAFDWDLGWQGKVQFAIAQMHIDDGDNAFEGDSNGQHPDQEPRSRPQFYNVTLIGANSSQVAQRGMVIREGSGGIFGNILLAGFTTEAIDLRGDVAPLVESGVLQFEDLVFFDIGHGRYFSRETGHDDDDQGFDEADYFSDPGLHNRFGLNPRLPPNAFSAMEPDFTPLTHSPLRDSRVTIPQGEFWDEGANYVGAIRPGVVSSWLDGWTAFPQN